MKTVFEKLGYIAYFSPTYPVRIAFYSNGPHLVLNYTPSHYEKGLAYSKWRVVDHTNSTIAYYENAAEAVEHVMEEGFTEKTVTSRVDHQFYEVLSYCNAGVLTAQKVFGEDILDKASDYADRMMEAFDKLDANSTEGVPHVQDVLRLLDLGIEEEEEVKGLHLVKEEEDG